jgi:hypothetical protein
MHKEPVQHKHPTRLCKCIKHIVFGDIWSNGFTHVQSLGGKCHCYRELHAIAMLYK